MWRSSKFSPKKNSQFLCLITWDCPCSLGIPKINQLETAVNHSNCSACLPDRENRETKILFYSHSWPEQKQSSPVPNTRPRRSGLPQIKEANCLDKTVDNFLVLIVKLHYIFSQIFVDVCGSKRHHKGSPLVPLWGQEGQPKAEVAFRTLWLSSWDSEPWIEERHLSSFRCFTTRGERYNGSQTLNS